MEYSEEDIRLLDVIANTKRKIPSKDAEGNQSAGPGGRVSTESTQSRTVDNSKIISSKNRAAATPRRVVQQSAPAVDPVREKILKACPNVPLFNGIMGREIFNFMLQPKLEVFKDGDEILKADSSTKRIYIPISGEVCIMDESHGMYALNGFVECFEVFNLAETMTYRKNRYTYIASGSGTIEVISFAINENQLSGSPKLFAKMYQNISKELGNRHIDKK
jgi:hypothetical protein